MTSEELKSHRLFLESHGMLADKVSKRAKVTREDLVVQGCSYCGMTPEELRNWMKDPNITGEDLVFQGCRYCTPQLRHVASEKEGLRVSKEREIRLMKERDAALAALERVKKDKSVLELELWKEKRCSMTMNDLVFKLDSELQSTKEAHRKLKDECHILQIEATQLERNRSKSAKKAKTAVVVHIPSADDVHPPRVKRGKKGKITRRGDIYMGLTKCFITLLWPGRLPLINLFIAFQVLSSWGMKNMTNTVFLQTMWT